MKVTFKVRTDRPRVDGTVAIVCVISEGSSIVRFNIDRFIIPAMFDSVKGKAKGKSPDATEINAYLQSLIIRLYEAERDLLNNRIKVTPKAVRELAMGLIPDDDNTKELGLLECVKEHVDRLHSVKSKTRLSDASLAIYKYTHRLLTAYIDPKNNGKDILLQDLKYSFIEGFVGYLAEWMAHNTITKHIIFLRTVIKTLIKSERLHKDPFNGFVMNRIKTTPIYLTTEEVSLIESVILSHTRHQRARDMFLFSCYTGLSFSDVMGLKPEDITFENGTRWIKKNRIKSKVLYRVPLIPAAEKILKLYSDKGEFIPKVHASSISFQLREIASLCNINKHITFHTARHTFATSMLNQRVPLEVVSKMLGHSNISMTQHYAKVVDSYILDSMGSLLGKAED